MARLSSATSPTSSRASALVVGDSRRSTHLHTGTKRLRVRELRPSVSDLAGALDDTAKVDFGEPDVSVLVAPDSYSWRSRRFG
jgi:hypothetical protein